MFLEKYHIIDNCRPDFDYLACIKPKISEMRDKAHEKADESTKSASASSSSYFTQSITSLFKSSNKNKSKDAEIDKL